MTIHRIRSHAIVLLLAGLAAFLSSCGESKEAKAARKEMREAVEAAGEYSEAQLEKLRKNLEPTIRETRKDLDTAVAEARRKLDALQKSGKELTAEQLRAAEEALRSLAESARRANRRLRGGDTTEETEDGSK